MNERDRPIEEFLAAAGWGGAARTPLAGDASFRRYERIARNGRHAMLMDAPPPMEDIRPFVRIARHLGALGYSAPEIIFEDAEAGLLLLEDLGDDTYTSRLEAGDDENALYRLAVDVLIDLHRRPAGEAGADGVPAYDDDMMMEEAALMTEWHLPAVLGADRAGALADSYRQCWLPIFSSARSVPDSLVLRDYHVDNLMRIDGREGIAACGLLDFQDAVVGPVSYDLMSLVEDARRDVDLNLATAMRGRYLAAFPDIDIAAYDTSFTVLAAQRHCKVIGIFTRLSVRDGKPVYLEHIPRLWRLLERALTHPMLVPLRVWFDTNVPGPCRRIPA